MAMEAKESEEAETEMERREVQEAAVGWVSNWVSCRLFGKGCLRALFK